MATKWTPTPTDLATLVETLDLKDAIHVGDWDALNRLTAERFF